MYILCSRSVDSKWRRSCLSDLSSAATTLQCLPKSESVENWLSRKKRRLNYWQYFAQPTRSLWKDGVFYVLGVWQSFSEMMTMAGNKSSKYVAKWWKHQYGHRSHARMRWTSDSPLCTSSLNTFVNKFFKGFPWLARIVIKARFTYRPTAISASNSHNMHPSYQH